MDSKDTRFEAGDNLGDALTSLVRAATPGKNGPKDRQLRINVAKDVFHLVEIAARARSDSFCHFED
jgi:hypothetical protein